MNFFIQSHSPQYKQLFLKTKLKKTIKEPPPGHTSHSPNSNNNNKRKKTYITHITTFKLTKIKHQKTPINSLFLSTQFNNNSFLLDYLSKCNFLLLLCFWCFIISKKLKQREIFFSQKMAINLFFPLCSSSLYQIFVYYCT